MCYCYIDNELIAQHAVQRYYVQSNILRILLLLVLLE